MSQRIFIVVLVLLSVGLGFHAYRQSTARAAAERQLAAAAAKKAEAAKPAPAPIPAHAAPRPVESQPAPPSPVMDRDIEAKRAEISARNDTPEAQRLMALQTRSALDSKYASLFMYLELPPEKLQKLQGLLQDRQNIFRDVMLAMRTQGLAPTPENGPKIQALVNNAAAEIEAQISSALGEADYAKYQKFQGAAMPRITAERVQQRLSYTSEPLSAPQYARLMDVLMQDAPSPAAPPTLLAPAPAPSAPPLITPAIINQARAFLSAAQLTALQSIQQEQEASAELSRR